MDSKFGTGKDQQLKSRLATEISSSHNKVTINKLRIGHRRKNFAKRRQQLEHWMSVLQSVHQNSCLEPAMQTTKHDDNSLSDIDIDLDDLESIPASPEEIEPTTEGEFFSNLDQPHSPAPEDLFQPITEEDFFANLDVNPRPCKRVKRTTNNSNDSLSDVGVCLEDLESIPGSSNQPLSPQSEEEIRLITEEDFFANFDPDSTIGVSFTTRNLETLQQHLTQPLEARDGPTTEEDIFAAFDAHLGIELNTPSNTSTQTTGEEDSLSDVDVDLDDLESIPESFVIPMLNEDGTPISDDPESDTTSNTSINGQHQPATPPTPQDDIRNLIIAVQGDDTDLRMEDTLFPTPPNRPTLANITVTSSYRNENGGRVIGVTTAHHRRSIAAIRAQIAEFQERMRQGDHTARLWPRRHANQENAPPAGRGEGTTEEQRRERAWREERDSMIFGWDDGQDGRMQGGERIEDRRVQRNMRVERWDPYQESWTRHMR
jgi:hypothetical protein